MNRPARHDILFEPIKVGPKTFRNRFYVAPHCTGLGVDFPGAQAYLRGMRAEGGWAAVNTEYCGILPESDDSPWVQARLMDEHDMANLSLMVERVHDHEALAGVQLVHMGADHTGFTSRMAAPGASQLPSALMGASCYEMSKADIRRVQAGYVAAAKRARDVGFDLVQISARVGFSLPVQFLWPYWNKRTDEYGGSLENRVRFWREALEMVRDAVGDDCAIVAGFCVDDFESGPDGFRVEQDGVGTISMLDHLVDLWDVQVSGDFAIDVSSSRFFPSFWQRSYISQIRAHTSKPIAAIGRFTDADLMAEVIDAGVIDIIGAARPAISDPFLPKKIEEGRIDDVRECIGCNMCVSRFNNGGGRIVCTQNATVGEEYRRGWHPERFVKPKNADVPVLIIGGGPSGMECATILGRRGMELVHLVDGAPRMGGNLGWTANLPGLAEWRRLIDYRETQLEKLDNVTLINNSMLDAEAVRNYGASLVIVATGSHWDPYGISPIVHSPIEGAGPGIPNLFVPEDLMVEGKTIDGDRVLVYDTDGYFMGPSIAEKLANEGKQVTLVCPSDAVTGYMFFTDEGSTMNRTLLEAGVNLCPSHIVSKITDNKVHGYHVYHEDRVIEWDVDAVVLVTRRISDTSLYDDLMSDEEALVEAGIDAVYRIGDCVEPRFMSEAVFDGHRLAREIDSSNPAEPLPFIREQRILGLDDVGYDQRLHGRADPPPSSLVTIGS